VDSDRMTLCPPTTHLLARGFSKGPRCAPTLASLRTLHQPHTALSTLYLSLPRPLSTMPFCQDPTPSASSPPNFATFSFPTPPNQGGPSSHRPATSSTFKPSPLQFVFPDIEPPLLVHDAHRSCGDSTTTASSSVCSSGLTTPDWEEREALFGSLTGPLPGRSMSLSEPERVQGEGGKERKRRTSAPTVSFSFPRAFLPPSLSSTLSADLHPPLWPLSVVSRPT
jgi:hypothetical protein